MAHAKTTGSTLPPPLPDLKNRTTGTATIVAVILAMICTVFSTLTMLVFCLAGSANASPEQMHQINRIMGGFSLLSLAGIATGIVLLRCRKPGWALVASILPTLIMFGALIYGLSK
ncbi:MAG: hypothetical protein KJT03_18040, partial [Verrucomicrobiae bacterium]|nr:hypothetical protein [Verrucomicrobiae bacterium]